MKFLFGIALTVAVFALFALTPLGERAVDLVTGRDQLNETPLDVTFHELEGSNELETPPAPLIEASARTDADSTEFATLPGQQAAPPTTGCRVRFLDTQGSPVSGVRVHLAGHADRYGTSDEHGVAKAWIPASVDAPGLDRSLRYEHPSYVPGWVDTTLELGGLIELGNVIIVPAGAIEVRVVDARGVPVEGALVLSRDMDELGNSVSELQQWRLRETADSENHQYPVKRTDAEGEFLLERVPEGQVRVWASCKGHLAACSPPVEVRRGMVTEQVIVTLGVQNPSDFITGQVLDPAGEPLADAQLHHRYRSLGSSGSGSFHVNKQGRFTIAYTPESPRDLRAADLRGRYSAARAEGVEGGADIILQFALPEHMLLTVETEDGTLEGLSAWGYSPNHYEVLIQFGEIEVEGDVLRVPVPAEPFVLDISADGHEEVSLGPFDGFSAPRELTVKLGALPGVRGSVSAGGKAVAGASISLNPLASGHVVHNGFPVRIDPSSRVRGESGPDGEFLVTLREGGDYMLRVSADGFAPSESGPHSIDPKRGLGPVKMALTPGGSIEGRLFGREDVQGHFVAISRGDGYARTVRTGLEGEFRFEHLVPGPWWVELTDKEIFPNASSTTMNMTLFHESDIETNCVVIEGQTTRHDISLGGEFDAILAGTLIINGSPATDWQAHLLPVADIVVEDDDAAKGVVGQDGSFRLKARRAGEYRLVVSPPDSHSVVLATDLSLSVGETSWQGVFDTGSVRFINVPAPDPEGSRHFLIGHRGEIDLVLVVMADETGVALVEDVPVMPATLVRFAIEDLLLGDDPREGGTPLQTVQLFAGETVDVILP